MNSSEIQPLFEDLAERLATESDLAPLNLSTLARASARITTQRVPIARLELGESRIGELPDVPPSFEWPRWAPPRKSDDGPDESGPSSPIPLGFIAQIDLSAIPRVDELLPDSGWLYFFYDRYREPWGFDPTDRGCCRVIYANCDRTGLTRAEPPPDADLEHVAATCNVEIWPELTLPDTLADVEYGTAAFEAYGRLCNELTKAGGLTQHRLWGHPQLIQNPMELECHLASNGIYCGRPSDYEREDAKALESGAVDWQLLLQIDTDEDGPGWMWGGRRSNLFLDQETGS